MCLIVGDKSSSYVELFSLTSVLNAPPGFYSISGYTNPSKGWIVIVNTLKWHLSTVSDDFHGAINRTVEITFNKEMSSTESFVYSTVYKLSTLSGSFCMNYCSNAEWHGGEWAASLLKFYGIPGCFNERCKCFLVSVIFIFFPTVSLWDLDQVIFMTNQAQKHHWNTFGSAGSVGWWNVLLGNELCISIKLSSRGKQDVFYNFLLDGCAGVGFDKTQRTRPADDMPPKTIPDCRNFEPDLKQPGFCASPIFLQTLTPWFQNEMQWPLTSMWCHLLHDCKSDLWFT